MAFNEANKNVAENTAWRHKTSLGERSRNRAQ
jgi:hypothetical protein